MTESVGTVRQFHSQALTEPLETHVRPFSRLRTNGPFIVRVHRGPGSRLVIHAPSSIAERVLLRSEEDCLDIRLAQGNPFEELVAIDVESPNLVAATCDGVGSVEIDAFRVDHFELSSDGTVSVNASVSAHAMVLRSAGKNQIRLSDGRFEAVAICIAGAGKVHVASPTTDCTCDIAGAGAAQVEQICGGNVGIRISGTGAVMMEGNGRTVDVDISGAGMARLESLEAQEVHVSTSGVGFVKIGPCMKLRAVISGAGGVTYRGEPAVEVVRSGIGLVRRVR
jgi:hypothetical protein